MSKHLKGIFLLLGGVLLGTIVSLTTTLALAHGGDTSKVHSCVRNGTLLPGAANVRIVSATTTCNNNETALDWDKNAASSSANFGLPFFCTECQLEIHANKFAGKDFSYTQLIRSTFENVDLTGVNFNHGRFVRSPFNSSNLTNANFSYTNISGVETQPLFQNANLTNANFSNAQIGGTFGAQSANFQNTNLQNAVITHVNLTGATNMDTANITGATWDNTTCPDGTNSDSNGNTCAGHLTP